MGNKPNLWRWRWGQENEDFYFIFHSCINTDLYIFHNKTILKYTNKKMKNQTYAHLKHNTPWK